MSTALVTGGSGFLGSFIADTLSERGFAVRIFDLHPSPYLRADQEMITGDLLDAEALAAAAAGCESLFHLAALSDISLSRERPRETVETNIMGTVQALEAARRAGARRFLFASTVYVYSRAGSFYRCSKQAAEEYIEEYQRRFDLPYTILRYGSLYGPRADRSNGVYRLLSQAAAEGRVALAGTAEDTREYIHVEDAARLSVDALASEYANTHVVITGSQSMRLRDLFTMFSEILGTELEIQYRQPAQGEGDGHYRVTPYAFSPRLGRKLTSNYYVDMGQGILQMLEQLHREAKPVGAESASGGDRG